MSESAEQPKTEMFETIEQGVEVYEAYLRKAIKQFREYQQEYKEKIPEHELGIDGVKGAYDWRIETGHELEGMAKVLGFSPQKIAEIVEEIELELGISRDEAISMRLNLGLKWSMEPGNLILNRK